MTDSKPKRRWYQFGLRTLFVFVAICAIPCGWVGVKMQHAKWQREAAEVFRKLGGHVEWSKPSGPVWLRSLLGDDFFRSVIYLDLGSTQVTDAELESIKGLSELQYLKADDTTVTDTGLAHLKGLSQLQWLGVYNTHVTNEGVKELQQALPNCSIAD